MTRAQKISSIEWIIIIAVALLDAVLAKTTGLSIKASLSSIAALGIIVALWPATFLLIHLTGFAKGAAIIPENAAKFFAFIAAGSALEYYAASSPLPLRDDVLVHIDEFFGFSWPIFFSWVQDHDWARRILSFCYFGLMYEAGAVLLVASIFYPQRANRFSSALIVSVLIAIACVSLFPVAGPFVYFGHADLPQADYTAHYIALRAHRMAFVPMDHLQGIISFPSFHVSSAVIMSYFLRRIMVLFPLSILLNIGMCIGALVIGGHYLSDVLAGIALGFVTIYIIKIMDGNEIEKRLPLFRAKENYSSHQLSSTKP